MTIDYVLREQFDALKVEVAKLRSQLFELQEVFAGRALAEPYVPPPVRGQAEAEAAIHDMKGKGKR